MARPRTGTLATLAIAAALAGCDAGTAGTDADATLTVYVSAPLSGPARGDGQDVADGARLALADAGGEAAGLTVQARYLDVAGRNESRFDPVTAAANARTAAEDSTTIAYVGELDSGASRTSVPVLNEAGILQVAPGSGAEDLVRDEPFNDDVPTAVQPTGTRTFAQLLPTYPEGGRPRPLEPAALPPAGRVLVRRFRERFGRDPGPYAAYGYEAMASILAAIDRAEDPADRASVVVAYFDGTERDSVLGSYRITSTGEAAR